MHTQYTALAQASRRYDYAELVAEARSRWHHVEALDLIDAEARAYTAWLDAMEQDAIARGEIL